MDEMELMRRSKKGDTEAFSQLVQLYQTKVVNIAYGMLSDREDAYDAAQEAFLKIYRSLDTFRGNSSVSTWIYRITANVCTDMLRKRQRSVQIIPIDEEPDEDKPRMELRDESPTPEEHAELSERQAALRQALSELGYEYRQIITLYDMEGLSYEEIAAALGCPTGTVKSRLSRARAALKKNLLKNRELF